MEEFDEEEGSGQSKLFVILAVALIGLLVLGLMGIGGVFVIRQNLREQAELAQPVPTVIIKLPNPTATFTPVAQKAPTNTPAPTPTNTPVLVAGGEAASVGGDSGSTADTPEQTTADQGAETEGPILRPAATRAPSGGNSGGSTPGEVPNTGLGGLDAALIALLLLAVLFIARRMRLAT
jgi:hypothetical protein